MHKKPATKTQSLSMHQIPKCSKSFSCKMQTKTAPQNQSFLKNQISKGTDFFFSMMTWVQMQTNLIAETLLPVFVSPWVCKTLALPLVFSKQQQAKAFIVSRKEKAGNRSLVLCRSKC
jgi:hypothetical protein